jgi:hypothetical protein
MHLARQFGEPNVDTFLESVSSHQILEWIALREIEPWGEELFYKFMSRAFSILANGLGGKTSPDDFLPKCWKEQTATPLDFKGLMAMAQRG